MPTVRRPSSLAARKMRMAISLRLAASNFFMTFIFTFTGTAQTLRETPYFDTSAAHNRSSFSNAENEGNLCGQSVGGGRRLGSFRFRREILQLLQIGFG